MANQGQNVAPNPLYIGPAQSPAQGYTYNQLPRPIWTPQQNDLRPFGDTNAWTNHQYYGNAHPYFHGELPYNLVDRFRNQGLAAMEADRGYTIGEF